LTGNPETASLAPDLPKTRPEQKGEATQSIAVVPAVIFLLPFSAQKSHVKSQNRLTNYNPTTSAWHFSFTQTATLDI
jgi:hypothetical protein